MDTKNIFKKLVLGLAMLFAIASATSVPLTMTFQGRLTDHGSPATGIHQMNFEIITGSGASIWRNDPTQTVAVTVVQGIYTIELGNTAIPNMAPLTIAAFDNTEKLFLRIWVNGEQLSPDIALIATPYSFIAQQAETLTANLVAGNSAMTAINTGSGQIDLARVNNAAAATRLINTGAGLTGGGDLTGDRTLSIANGGITSIMLATSLNINGTITTANYANNVDWTNISNIPALAAATHQHTGAVDGGLLNPGFLYTATVSSANYATDATNAALLNNTAAAGNSAVTAINTGATQINLARVNNAAAATRLINTGAGLTGGGDLSADRTLSIANGGITSAMLTNNIVINGTITTTNYAVTSNYSNFAGDADTVDGQHAAAFAPVVRNINTGSGLTGGGNLSADRTLSIANGGITSAMLTNNIVINGTITTASYASTANYANHVDWTNISNIPALATAAHTHDASSINSGVLNDARLSNTITKLGQTIEGGEISTAAIGTTHLSQMGAANGQIMKWNGSAWAPAADNNTVYTHPNHSGDVTSVGDGATTIANGVVNSAKITDGTIAAADISSMNASNGQVMKWNGSAWVPAADIDTDTNTTYTAGAGMLLTGTVFSIASQNASNGQVLKYNGTNFVPAADTDTNTTYTAGTGLTLSGTQFNVSTVPIANGGTNQTSYITNGVTYYNGTAITTNANFTFTGPTLNVNSLMVATVSANGSLDFIY